MGTILVRRGRGPVAFAAILALAGALLVTGPLAPVGRAGAAPLPYSLNLAYADNLRANPSHFPTPWNGSPNAVFEGCGGSCTFDSGAIEIVNTSASTITVDSVMVDFSTCHYDIWPHSVSLATGQQLIMTQLTGGAGYSCPGSTAGFDSSDIGPNGANWAANCSQSGVVPQVTVSVNGTSTGFADSGKILNTGGFDAAACASQGATPQPYIYNESTQWTPVGKAACPGASLVLTPASQSLAPSGTAGTTATLTDSCGDPIAGVSVKFTVTAGPNSGATGTGTTDSTGKATFSYSSSVQGVDYVQASITNVAGTFTSNTVTVIWETATLALTPGSGLPGATINFTGTGYGASETVNVHFGSTSGTTVATVTSTAGGAISGSFVVPVPAGGAPVNSVVAVGATSGKQGWAPFSSSCTTDWTNAAGGNFNTPGSWSGGSVPGTSDLACIILPGTFTVTMTQNNSVGALLLGNGSTGTQTLNLLSNGATAVGFNLVADSTIAKTGVLSMDTTNSGAPTFLTGGATLTDHGVLSTVQDAGSTRYIRLNLNVASDGSALINAADTRQDSGTTTTNNGTFTVGAGGGLSVSNSAFTEAAGTLSNGGSFSVGSSTFNQNGGVGSGNPVTLSGSTMFDTAGTGSFLLICGNGLNGTVALGQTVTVQGNGPCGSATTTLGNVTNSGAMVMDSTNAQGYSLLQGGTLTNKGSFTTLKGAGGTRYIRVPFNNSKTGKVIIGSASTLMDSSTATTNAGLWTVNPGSGLSVNGGTFMQSGTVVNKGVFFVNNSTFTQSGGKIKGTIILQSTTLADSAGPGGPFILQCGNTLSGTIPILQTVDVQGNACGNSDTTLSGDVNNKGTLVMDSLSSGAYSYVHGSGTLTNNGTLTLSQGLGNIRYLRVNLVNTATGKVTIGAANTLFDGSTATSNSGSFTISAGAGLAVLGGSVTQSAGSLANSGSFYARAVTFTQSNGTLSGNPLVLESATLADGPGIGGTFILQCADTLSGTIPSGQTVDVQGNACGSAGTTLSGTVVNNGTLKMESTSSGSYSLISGGPLTNNATFSVLQGLGNTRYVRVNIANTAGATMSIGAVDTRFDQATTTTNDGTVTVLDGATLAEAGSTIFTQHSGGTLDVAVDVPANAGYGITGGTVTVAGTLGVTTVGTPTPGSKYNVISGATFSGTFATVTSPVSYTVGYAAGGVTLTAN